MTWNLKCVASTAPIAGTADEQRALKLGFCINDTARLRRLAFDAVLRPEGFTTSQASVLRHLSSKDGLSQSELAQQLDLGKVGVGEIIDRLAAAGFLERRASEIDRRMWNIFLTPAGRRAVTKLRRLALRQNERILAGLSPEQVREALHILEVIKSNLLQMTRG